MLTFTLSDSRFARSFHSARRLSTVISAIALFGASALLSQAAPILVPNFSFESPDIVYASGGPIDSWTKIEPQAPQVGLFDNPPVNSPQGDHIDNPDGAQFAFVFAGPGIGLFQELTTTYQAGKYYTLTVAVGGGGGNMAYGTTLQLRLYYLDALNVKVNLATKDIVFDAALDALDPQPINHLFDYTASTPVAITSALVGKAIGVEIIGTAGDGGGYWDVDNVRVEVVPEPSVVGLLMLGFVGAGLIRRRRSAA